MTLEPIKLNDKFENIVNIDVLTKGNFNFRGTINQKWEYNFKEILKVHEGHEVMKNFIKNTNDVFIIIFI